MTSLQASTIIASSVGSFVLVILAWLFSNARLSRVESNIDMLNTKLDANMTEIRHQLSEIHNHLMTFYTVTGKLEGRIDELSRR